MLTGPGTPTRSADALTPRATKNTSNHQQMDVFGSEDRPKTSAPIEDAAAKGRFGERTLGESAGSDTTGAVAPPAEEGRHGAPVDLGGTPGALATDSIGRQRNF